MDPFFFFLAIYPYQQSAEKLLSKISVSYDFRRSLSGNMRHLQIKLYTS